MIMTKDETEMLREMYNRQALIECPFCGSQFKDYVELIEHSYYDYDGQRYFEFYECPKCHEVANNIFDFVVRVK